MPSSSHILCPLWGKLRLRLIIADPVEGLGRQCQVCTEEGVPGDGAHRWRLLPGQAWSQTAHLLLLTPQECTPPSITSLSCSSCLDRKPAQIWPRSPGGSLRVSEAWGLYRASASTQGTCRCRSDALRCRVGTGNARPAPAPGLAIAPCTPRGAVLGAQTQECAGWG